MCLRAFCVRGVVSEQPSVMFRYGYAPYGVPALGVDDLERDGHQVAFRRDVRVLRPESSRGAVPRVRERFLSEGLLATVAFVERLDRLPDLCTDDEPVLGFHFVGEPQPVRDAFYLHGLSGDEFADCPVSSGCGLYENAVFVREDDGQPVDFQFDGSFRSSEAVMPFLDGFDVEYVVQ